MVFFNQNSVGVSPPPSCSNFIYYYVREWYIKIFFQKNTYMYARALASSLDNGQKVAFLNGDTFFFNSTVPWFMPYSSSFARLSSLIMSTHTVNTKINLLLGFWRCTFDTNIIESNTKLKYIFDLMFDLLTYKI